MTRTTSLVLSVLSLCVVVACASDGDPGDLDVSSRDPRCVAACTQPEPRYAGVGEVCNAASRVQCLDVCESRIASLMTVCQNCLVEGACFGPDGCDEDVVLGGSCTNNTCTITSEFGTCSYMTNDEAGKLKCYQQVDPRREVTCESEFRPTTQCASVCS